MKIHLELEPHEWALLADACQRASWSAGHERNDPMAKKFMDMRDNLLGNSPITPPPKP